MDTQGKKLAAKFRFGVDQQPGSFQEPRDGTMHLFEHAHGGFKFWYGVAQITGDQELYKWLDEADKKRQTVFVNIQFEDGHTGLATYVGGNMAGGGYFALALTGYAGF
jgi:hypothetical protein